MPLIISSDQAAFVGKRQIIIYDVFAQEFKRKGKEKIMALKLDTSKAYDCAEWPYFSILFF